MELGQEGPAQSSSHLAKSTPSSTLEVKEGVSDASAGVVAMTEELLTIGELARQAGVATSTLRYYEDVGLLPPAERVSGQRRYAPSMAGAVGVILLLRDVGFTLREIQELLEARADSPRGWRDVTERKLADLDRQIATTQVAREALVHALGCKHHDILDCPNFQAVMADHLAGRARDRSAPHRSS
jgi:DNA-binding transcriptional MerR regulator